MKNFPRHIRIQVILLTIIRWVTATSLRMVYPFLPVFARGLGVSLTTISSAVGLRSLIGALSPLLSPIADRYSRRTGMLLGIGVFVLGCTLVFIFPTFPVFILALCLNSLGAFVYLSSTQAYIGDTIPYEKRGTVIGVIELSWSLCFILGVPAIGMMIGHFGWLSPFPVLAVMGVIVAILLLRILPNEPAAAKGGHKITQHFKLILKSPNAMIALAMSLALGFLAEVIYIVFGVWMEDSFGLKIAALGAVSALIGFSELLGEALTTTLTDRLGKKRSIVIGATLHAMVTLSMLLLRKSFTGAVIGLLLYAVTFEFAFISVIPLMSELVPESRASFMGLYLACLSLGRSAGALLGPILYVWGFQANILAGFAAIALALLALSKIKLPDET
ncbi:MAG: MFS transporter [Anaerolineaceae bacterium]|nr:MFS transporter [Anaerolineaceae bacterium]